MKGEQSDIYAPNVKSGGNPSYDLAVVGAGSAGFSAAIAAADAGAQVALIGHGTIGGTCVNVGCVPSKALIRAAEALHHARTAPRFTGLDSFACVKDWGALVAQKDELVGQLRQAKYIDLLPSYDNVAYVEGRARLVDDGISVDGEGLIVGKIVIATGSSPYVPDLPGLDASGYHTSTTVMELSALPESLIVVGGGYIGCELAQMLARAGVKITMLCRRRLLPEAEPEISEILSGVFRAEGIDVICGAKYKEVERVPDGVVVHLKHSGEPVAKRAEALLLATGRRPNTADIGLATRDVAVGDGGGIVVDDRMRTTASGIYAAGDVTGRDEFVYMAAHGGRVAAENALNGDGRSYDRSAIPSVVFTDPQVASVGSTEEAARADGIDVKTAILTLDHLPRALAARDTRGLIKLVADKSTDRLLGAHLVAPEGADSIQTAVLAIKMGMTTKALAETIFPYLTTVEGLKLAAQTFEKDVSKLSCCAG